jgi:hypothetical protein
MTEQPDARAALEAASDAIDRACAEHKQRDPEQAASFRDQQEQVAAGLRDLRETYGVTVPETVIVTWARG